MMRIRENNEYTLDELKNYMDEGDFVKVENYIREKELETTNTAEFETLRDYFRENIKEPGWRNFLKKLSYHSLSLTLGVDNFNKILFMALLSLWFLGKVLLLG